MNDDFNYEAGLSTNAKIAIGVAVGVVAVGLVVGAVLILRSRAGGAAKPLPTQQQTDSAGAVNAPAAATPLTPEQQFAKSREVDLKAAEEYDKSHPFVVDDSGIKYGVEQTMTAEELQQMGYPAGTDIRYKYVKAGADSVIQGPIRIYTKAPPSASAPYPPAPAKKPPSQAAIPVSPAATTPAKP